MNIFRTVAFRAIALALALPLFALLVGCEVDSTTSVPSDNSGTIYNFSGLYLPIENTNGLVVLVFPTNKQSGVDLTWLRLLQYGSVLEAYDSAGLNWSGSISGIQGTTASFGLTGKTTANQPVEISGTLEYADQKSLMNAAWIEPGFAGSILAQATVSPAATNAPVGNIQVIPEDFSVDLSQTVTLNASGCSGTYTWEQSNAFGTLTPNGNTATYKRTGGTSAQSVKITVTCSSGGSGSTTMAFN